MISNNEQIMEKSRAVFSNFNNKIILGINFDKRLKNLKLQASTIRLNNRSNTENQGTENQNGTAKHSGKIINVYFVKRQKQFVIMRLRIRIVGFMRSTAK